MCSSIKQMMVNVTMLHVTMLPSGDLVSNYPTPPALEKGYDTSSPTNHPPCPQINLELPMFTLTLQREKRKISEVFQGLPKLSQS